MMRSSRRIGVAVLSVSLVAVGACHKKPLQVTQNPTPVAQATAPSNADALAAAARAREDSIRQAEALAAARRAQEADAARAAAAASNAAAAEAARLKDVLLAVVHFELDQSNLSAETKAALDAKVPILQANPSVTLTIAGHADDRGSDEHNMALGISRASSAKQYLVDHGIAASRLQTTSYGEERPVCQQEEEACYAQNRRAEFQITAGPAMLKR